MTALHQTSKGKSKLQDLNLSFNKIGEKGGESVARMIWMNKSLLRLNLTFNLLSEANGNSIIAMLARNSVIQ